MLVSEGRADELFSYVDLEAPVRPDHSLRSTRQILKAALKQLQPDFGTYCSKMGRPSIAPVKLLCVILCQALYSIHSERRLMDRLKFDLLFHLFVGLGIDVAVWDHSVFPKKRDRLLDGDVAAKLLAALPS